MNSVSGYTKVRGTNHWDVAIVGGGPAGCSAAMVLARSRRTVLLLDGGNQRNISSHGLRNFLTRDGILPPDFLKLAYEDLARYPITLQHTEVSSVQKTAFGFELTDQFGEKYSCRKLLLATGVTDEIPDVPGMRELWGCSVFHCPFCDGYECAGYPVGLFASKHNGYGMALALRHLTSDIILFTDGSQYLRQAQRQELKQRNVRVVTKRIQQLIYTGNKLECIRLITGEDIPCSYLFVHHNFHVNSLLLEQLSCKTSKKGAAITNRRQETSIPGVYVAGDASYDVHFVVVAASEGVKAAVAIHNGLLQEDNRAALAAGQDKPVPENHNL